MRKKYVPLFYSSYKVIQSVQLGQGGLTVLVTSTIENGDINQLLVCST
jgi:hypothetical protein